MSRRPTVSRRGKAIVLTLHPPEIQVLQWVFGDLGRILAAGVGGSDDEPTDDAVRRRLFPRAYLDPTEEAAEAQWREVVHDDLVDTRFSAMTDVVESLDTAVVLTGREELREIVLDDDRAQHWMTVLNDARLAVGTALDVTPEWDFTDLDPTDPNYEMHAVYAWMTELMGALVAAIAG